MYSEFRTGYHSPHDTEPKDKKPPYTPQSLPPRRRLLRRDPTPAAPRSPHGPGIDRPPRPWKTGSTPSPSHRRPLAEPPEMQTVLTRIADRLAHAVFCITAAYPT